MVMGSCIVSICNSTSRFSILDFYSHRPLLDWHRDGMKRSGCIKSLVFIEATGTCRGGPGLLWLQCSMPEFVTLQRRIHE